MINNKFDKSTELELEEDAKDLLKTGSFQNVYTDNVLTTQTNSNPNGEESVAEAPIIMTLDIDSGKTDKIFIFLDSNSEKLAFDFCKKHNLNYDSLGFLKTQIERLITENVEKVGIVNNLLREPSIIKKERNQTEGLGMSMKENKNFAKQDTNYLLANTNLQTFNDNKLFSYEIFMKKEEQDDNKSIGSFKKSRSTIQSKVFNPKIELQKAESQLNEKSQKGTELTTNQIKGSKKSSTHQLINPGERMYRRGLTLKEQSIRKLQNVKKSQSKQFQEKCTFSPKLQSPSHFDLANLKVNSYLVRNEY
jgi:hypothetical protein